MDALEAKKITLESVPDFSDRLIEHFEKKIHENANDGYFATCIAIKKDSIYSNIFQITDIVADYFADLGYEVSVEDWDISVLIVVSWANA